MSLRDQLLKAKLIDKKQHRRANTQLKRKRRKSQAKRRSRKDITAEQTREETAHREAELAQRLAEKQARDALKAAAEKIRLVGNLLRSYSRRVQRGPLPFYHLAPDRVHIQRLWLRESAGWDLRGGRLAIGWLGDDPEEPEIVLLAAEAARRIQRHEPDRILFLNDGPPPADDPAEKLHPFNPPPQRGRR